MTSVASPASYGPWSGLARWRAPVALLAGLGGIVATRWWATRAGGDALAVGAAFGIALVSLALVSLVLVGHTSRARVRVPAREWLARTTKAAGVGLAFGCALVALVLAGAWLSGSSPVPGLGRPAAPFLPWAAITILVAGGEEALLRGRIFDAIRDAAGGLPAVLVTTAAFALMHVPLYGWHVVPLDLAVGLGFAGLRLLTGSVVAPAAAHAVADLATWWI